jgi:hypothetical protein
MIDNDATNLADVPAQIAFAGSGSKISKNEKDIDMCT